MPANNSLCLKLPWDHLYFLIEMKYFHISYCALAVTVCEWRVVVVLHRALLRVSTCTARVVGLSTASPLAVRALSYVVLCAAVALC